MCTSNCRVRSASKTGCNSPSDRPRCRETWCPEAAPTAATCLQIRASSIEAGSPVSSIRSGTRGTNVSLPSSAATTPPSSGVQLVAQAVLMNAYLQPRTANFADR